MSKQLCSLITHSAIPKAPEASLLEVQSLRSHPRPAKSQFVFW